MIDRDINYAARQICAEQDAKGDTDTWALYVSGAWDDTIWMHLVEQGIRRGIEMERADHLATDYRHVSPAVMAAALREQSK